MLGLALALALWQQPAPPGSGYWQQEVSYRITAMLDEPRGTLGGTQRIVYRNNSPDTLRTFSLHLYLNAFRPGSRWADADSAEKRRRFNDLRDPAHAFNRISGVRIMGRPVEPVWPFAPDSTIARFVLPDPLPPGDSMEVTMDWWARPSTLPRRQGRRGRHYDLAQWYPRVVVYDRLGWQEHPLYPAGEFYGEFGDFTVALDVPEDQVIGATGVPVCGDPGWQRAGQTAGRTGGQPVDSAESGRRIRDTTGGVIRRLDVIPEPDSTYYRRDFYGSIEKLGLEEWCGAAPSGPGRKRVIWRAEDVHHFAMSMSPDYRYEGGRFRDIAVHVLYRPGDERTWGGGVAVERTVAALTWLDGLFGAYPWPQITNVHRIEGGGTEFPMMVHNGSAGQGLIVHEVGHNYLMGILANNEWREGFLDEGFTSFQTDLFNQVTAGTTRYRGIEAQLLLSDLDGWSQPTSLVSERYRDFPTYNAMVYNRGELFFHQLRRIVGDETLVRILRTYYDRWKLKHVDETAFREVAEEVSGQDLSTFFRQWLHSVTLYDYAVGGVKVEAETEEAGYRTRVEVVRKAPGVFPVEVLVRSGEDSALVVTDGVREREWVTVATRGRPREVLLNPDTDAHDWNIQNDRKTKGLLGWGRRPRTELYLDTQLSKRIRRDRVTMGLAPTIWYNDHGGIILGARARADYLGRFDQNTGQVALATRETESGVELRLRDPAFLYSPRMTQSLELQAIESRNGAAMGIEKDRTRHRTFGPQTFLGASVRWIGTEDTDFLDPTRWDDGGFVEGNVWLRSGERRGAWDLSGRVDLGGGLEYRTRRDPAGDENFGEQAYLRVTGEAKARRAIGGSAFLGVRAFGGWIESARRTLEQRRLFLAGGDPVAEFRNPFLRSRGALLAGHDVHYHLPGGGGVRGLSPSLTASLLGGVSVELERRVFRRGASAGLFRELHVAAFGDGALADGDIREAGGSGFAGDVGLGVRAWHRIGDTRFVTRIDLPVVVSRAALAVHERGDRVRLRYVVSFEPAI